MKTRWHLWLVILILASALILAGVAVGIVASLRAGPGPGEAPCVPQNEFDQRIGFKGI